MIDLASFDPFSHQVQQNPHPYYAAMRAASPAWRQPGTNLHFVTRFDLVSSMLRDTATFSSAVGATPNEPPPDHLLPQINEIKAKGWIRPATMLTVDPPDHTRYRGTVARAFNARSIAAMRPAIEVIVKEELDNIIGAGVVDFRTLFARPVPVRVIVAALGLNPNSEPNIGRWSDDSTVSIGAKVSDERALEAHRGMLELQMFMHGELTARQRERRDDVVTMLVEALLPLDDGRSRPMTIEELMGILQQLIGAGNETTTKLLSETMLLLGRNPQQWDMLRADPSRATAVVEEALRLSSPTQGMFRTVTRDVDVEGVPLTAGDRVVLSFSAANRDPDKFVNPDDFNPDRPNVRDHIAFGLGVHFCIGAPLARLESVIAIEELARRASTLTLSPDNTYEYEPSYILRGLHKLLVSVNP